MQSTYIFVDKHDWNYLLYIIFNLESRNQLGMRDYGIYKTTSNCFSRMLSQKK